MLSAPFDARARWPYALRDFPSYVIKMRDSVIVYMKNIDVIHAARAWYLQRRTRVFIRECWRCRAQAVLMMSREIHMSLRCRYAKDMQEYYSATPRLMICRDADELREFRAIRASAHVHAASPPAVFFMLLSMPLLRATLTFGAFDYRRYVYADVALRLRLARRCRHYFSILRFATPAIHVFAAWFPPLYASGFTPFAFFRVAVAAFICPCWFFAVDRSCYHDADADAFFVAIFFHTYCWCCCLLVYFTLFAVDARVRVCYATRLLSRVIACSAFCWLLFHVYHILLFASHYACLSPDIYAIIIVLIC